MITQLPKLALLLSFLLSQTTFAARAKNKPKANSGTRLETEMAFSGADVTGRYNYGDEAMAKIENEKPMIQLIEVPTHFKSRLLKQAKERPIGARE